MLRYDRQIKPCLVALYDIWPGNRVGLFLQPRKTLYCIKTSCTISDNSIMTYSYWLQRMQCYKHTINIWRRRWWENCTYLEIFSWRRKAWQWCAIRLSVHRITDVDVVRVGRCDTDEILGTDSCHCQRTDVTTVSTAASNVVLLSRHCLKYIQTIKQKLIRQISTATYGREWMSE